jgi:hypothetical protein
MTTAAYNFDVGAAQSREELYATISAALGRPCPDPYSLVWELDDLPMPVEITVTGMEALLERLPLQAKLLMVALRDVAERHRVKGHVPDVV